jgi:epoxyqueuosine reductase QueG
MEHPVLNRIRAEAFTPLGWFEPAATDAMPGNARFVILIGNAGPAMFRRFARERNPQQELLDVWTKSVIDPLANDLGARAVYPFDKPPQPFLTWARRGGAGYTSPLGLNIHPVYGLWHAYRAALLFPVAFDMPHNKLGQNPCESCDAKPCLSACPVSAFDGTSYDVQACGQHIKSNAGQNCMTTGCKARLACPVGEGFVYQVDQREFHMKAFLKARQT